mmetsp:Transcript_33756/g.72933  ORF Transcript_33756/g.72933 Transcript_33756/m.72933 type:complete len:211 (-) Transcript_33756:1522-2154(-)
MSPWAIHLDKGGVQGLLSCCQTFYSILLEGDWVLSQVFRHAIWIFTLHITVVAHVEFFCFSSDIIQQNCSRGRVWGLTVAVTDGQLIVCTDRRWEDVHGRVVLWEIQGDIVHDTCSDAMPFGTADVLQALLRDGSAALEIVPEPQDVAHFMHDDTSKPFAHQHLQLRFRHGSNGSQEQRRDATRLSENKGIAGKVLCLLLPLDSIFLQTP